MTFYTGLMKTLGVRRTSLRNTSLYISSVACASVMKMYNFPSHSHSVTSVLLLALQSAHDSCEWLSPFGHISVWWGLPHGSFHLNSSTEKRKYAQMHNKTEDPNKHIRCPIFIASSCPLFSPSFSSSLALSHIEIYKIWHAIMYFKIIFIKWLLSAFIIMVNTHTHTHKLM